jgi:hypothetical protein
MQYLINYRLETNKGNKSIQIRKIISLSDINKMNLIFANVSHKLDSMNKYCYFRVLTHSRFFNLKNLKL